MTDIPAKTFLTPIEARRKWRELMHAQSRTYMHFLEADGEWRPELHDGELSGYRWSKLHKVKNKPWLRS